MKRYLSLIRFSHTIFAMPFAMIGFFLGLKISGTGFRVDLLVMVTLCMVFARSAAMAFNRWLDRDIDAINHRTAVRDIPSGLISEKSALWFVIITGMLFIITTYFINHICFVLSPVALVVILGYSYTKRFTSWCHLILGVGLALAPVGAYLAVTGEFGMISILLGAGVLFWVAGFDIIYSLQDEEFDRTNKLNSLPVAFGRITSLRLSELFHLCTAIFFGIAIFYSFETFEDLGMILTGGYVVFLILLIYQHIIIKPSDLSRINMAFFTTNGVASLLFGFLFILDLMI
ncbi:MAG: UbiA family prenyltransferase [Saprospiraceae bacterium]|nr:UbiA family prenyltransferase [Saprospiraceae bacterium]